MAFGSWAKAVVGKGAQLAGRTFDYATPGSGTSTLTKLGRNIDDPYKNWKGDTNWNVVDADFSDPRNTGGSPLLNPNYQAPSDQQVAGATNTVPTTGIYDASGSGGASDYDPDLDPAKIAAQREQIQNMMAVFNDAFNTVMSKIDRLAAEKRGEMTKVFERNRGQLTTNYGEAASDIDQGFRARNSFNSSFRGREQGVAQNAFEDAMAQLGEAHQGNLGKVGEFANTQKASIKAARPTYDLGDYESVSELLDIKQNVDQALKQLGVTRAELGTQGEYVKSLDAIAPVSETGSATLKAQLDRLAGTDAPADAKRAIAQQAINDAGEDETQWLDYFERTMAATGSQTTQPLMG